MSELEVCPKCAAQFPARGALRYGGVPVAFGFITYPGVDDEVQCPRCKHQFRAVHLRLLGVPSGWLRWLLLAGAVLFLLLLTFLAR
jgi:hypothetical protein